MKYPTNPSAFTSLAMPSPFLRGACRLLLRSFATFPHLDALFSIVCSLFSKNTWVGGTLSHPPTFSTFGLSDVPTSRRYFVRPLFSHTYKSLLAEPLCFHIHTNPGGVTQSYFQLSTVGVFNPTLQRRKAAYAKITSTNTDP